MSFNSLLRHTCTIQVRTVTYNSDTGQQVESWADSVTGVKCRLDQAKGSEYRQPTAIYSKATHVLFMATRTLSPKNNLVIIDSNTYNILDVSDGGGAGHHIEVLLERIVQ